MNTASASTAVRVAGLTKRFGRGEAAVLALRGVDLEVRTGELLMLVGPSGCGKTPLISVLAGIMDKTEGELSVLGTDPGALRVNDRTRWRGAHIGFVFQAFNLMPALTAAENVSIPLLIRSVPQAEALRRARCRSGSSSATAPMRCRRNCRAASSSGWRSPARWCTSRSSWCATSPRPRWTTRPAIT
jgi:putative ABC transport system ATP-binding protein